MGIQDKSGISVTSGFKLVSSLPLDVRTEVDSVSDIDDLITSNAVYEELQIYCKATKSTYKIKSDDAGGYTYEVYSPVLKENETTYTTSTPDETYELLGEENSSLCSSGGWLDSTFKSLITANPDTEVLSVSSTVGTTGSANAYTNFPILKIDPNKYQYHLKCSSNSYSIRHFYVMDQNLNSIAYFPGSSTISEIKAAFAYAGADSTTPYQSGVDITIDFLKKINEYCTTDETYLSKSYATNVVTWDSADTSNPFYVVMTTSTSGSTSDARIATAALWSLVKTIPGVTTTHSKYYISGAAIDGLEGYDSDLLVDNLNELKSTLTALGVSDLVSETTTVPATSTELFTADAISLWGNGWAQDYLTSSAFDTLITDYTANLNDASAITSNTTTTYLSAPIVRLDFSGDNANNYYILKTSSSGRYIRHLYMWSYRDGNLYKWLALNSVSDITSFIQAYYEDFASPSSYYGTGLVINNDLIKAIAAYGESSGSTSFSSSKYLDTDEVFFLAFNVQISTATSGTVTDSDRTTAKSQWSLTLNTPSYDVTTSSFRLDNLSITDENGYFDGVTNLNDVLEKIGEFQYYAAPTNFNTEYNTTTTELYEEDTNYEGYYVRGTVGGSVSYIAYSGYCPTTLMPINRSADYKHSYLRHFLLLDENQTIVYFDEYVNAGTYTSSFFDDYPTAVYAMASNTGTNRSPYAIFTETITTESLTFEMPNLRLSENNGAASSSTTTNTFDLYDVDRVGVIGDSYTESHYTIKDKSWLSKLSLFTDYNIENFAISGDTFRGQLNKIRTGTYSYYSSMNWESFHPTHAMMLCRTNDIKYMDETQFFNDLTAILETTNLMGAVPILATEYHVANNDGIPSMYTYLAKKYGGYFIDLVTDTYANRGTDYSPFWGGSHPGTRSNSLLADPCIHFFEKNMPRPYQSIKIFRTREDPTELDDLIFSNIYERAEKFKEISISHSALNEPKYYDSCTGRSNSKVPSEYLQLMNGASISFSKYCLIDIILPSTSLDLTEVDLTIDGIDDGVTCYVHDALAEPYPSVGYYRRFDIASVLTEGTDFVIGNTYTSSNHSDRVYTLKEVYFDQVESADGFVDGTLLVMSNDYSSTATDEGTLTLVSGTGTSELTYTYSAVALPSDYPEGKQDIGHWVALDDFGVVQKDLLRRSMVVDRLSFLLVSDSDFNIKMPTIKYYGNTTKYRDTTQFNRNIEYEDTTASLTLTNTTSSMPDGITPTDSNVPKSATNSLVYPFTTSDTYSYTIDLGASQDALPSSTVPFKIKVRVVARYYPEIFDADTGTFGEGTSPISLNSFDWGKMKLKARFQSSETYFIEQEKYVSTHWSYIDFDLYVINWNTSSRRYIYLDLISENDLLQFASISAFVDK